MTQPFRRSFYLFEVIRADHRGHQSLIPFDLISATPAFWRIVDPLLWSFHPRFANGFNVEPIGTTGEQNEIVQDEKHHGDSIGFTEQRGFQLSVGFPVLGPSPGDTQEIYYADFGEGYQVTGHEVGKEHRETRELGLVFSRGNQVREIGDESCLSHDPFTTATHFNPVVPRGFCRGI